MPILTVCVLLPLPLLPARITLATTHARPPLADVTRTFAWTPAILHVWPLPHATHAAPCRFKSQSASSPTSATAIPALDCSLYFATIIIVIIKNSSCMCIAVGVDLWTGVALARCLLFLDAMGGELVGI